MGLLSKLVVGLGLDAGEYNRGLDDAKGKAQTAAQAIGSKLSSIGDKMAGVGQKLSAGLTLPLAAMGVGALNAASDLEESTNKVAVVFGDSAGEILGWSATAATALGQSRQEALEAAGTFGNLFTAMAMGQEESAEMSMNLVDLASDLASFNNIDPAVALEKLRAGLVGEVEPLRTLGVNLSAATVATKALEMGLVSAGEELTPAAKAQAAYALIMEQTTNAQGDFARTSEGLANQTRIAKAQFQDAAATLGQQLLPVGLRIVTWINELMTRFQALTPEQQKMIVLIGGIAAAVGPLLLVLGTLISTIGTIVGGLGTVAGVLTGPVGLAIAAVVAAVIAFKLAWDANFLGIRDTLMNIWNNVLLPAFQQIRAWLQENIPRALDTLRSFWENVLLPAIQKVWSFIQANVIPVFVSLATGAMAMLKKGLGVLQNLWENVLLPAMRLVWSFIETTLIPLLRVLAEVGLALVQKALEILAGIWENVLLPAIRAVWSFIEAYAYPLLLALANVAIAAVSTGLEILTGIWENVLLPVLKTVWDFIKTKVIPIFEAIARVVAQTLGPKLQWLKDHVLAPVAGAFSAIGGAIQDIIGWLTDLATKISNLELPNWLTPGSPTPFELGLRGINEELKKMARSQLPTLQMELQATAAGAAGGAGPTNQFNLTVHGVQQPEDVVYRFGVMRALAGA